MKKVFAMVVSFAVLVLIVSNLNIIKNESEEVRGNIKYTEIIGTIEKGETLFSIFKKYGLDIAGLFKLKEASADIHRLRELQTGQPYKIIIDSNNQINSFEYWIDDDSILNITRNESGFSAEKKIVEYEKRIQHIGGLIEDNLISSMGEGRENLRLALNLSDIFAWDIDFTSDLRNGDVFKIVVEGFYINGEFKKYGEILSAEFENNGKVYHAYRFEIGGKADYYDATGKSFKKAFLKTPLSFRRVSSYFSKGRFHPILKIYRPHHGLDYAAPSGTPVSVVGDGIVSFRGDKGQYGNLVVVRHSNGWKTYYGHLSRIGKGIKTGRNVEQGQIIGYVGATGLATGPHLHYEIRVKNKPVNPFALRLPQGKSIPKTLMAEFRQFKNQMDTQLASITLPVFASAQKKEDNKKQDDF